MIHTLVEIDFFKPEGFSDSYLVATEDRGLAARVIMARYDAKMLHCLNSVSARYRDKEGWDHPIIEVPCEVTP